MDLHRAILRALQTALTKRPEFDAARAALARDETQIRLAHNHLLPQLDLTGLYASNGLGGAGFNSLGQPISSSWVNQMFSFNYPTYEAQLTLSLPLKNRAAKAEMGTALVGRRNDLYSQRQIREQVTLDVSNAVHQLEQAKLSIVASKEALDNPERTGEPDRGRSPTAATLHSQESPAGSKPLVHAQAAADSERLRSPSGRGGYFESVTVMGSMNSAASLFATLSRALMTTVNSPARPGIWNP